MKQEKRKKSGNLRRLAQYYKPYRGLFFSDMFFAVLGAAMTLGIPLIVRYITSTVVQFSISAAATTILRLGLWMIAMVLVEFGCNFYIGYFGHIMGAKIEHDMRNEIFTHYQKLSFSFFDDQKVGHLLSRVTSDLFDISELLHHGPEDLVISIIKIAGSLVILFNINAPLAVVPLVLVCAMFAFAVTMNRRMKHAFAENRRRIADINSQIEDSLSGIRVVKSFGNEKEEIKKFRSGNERFVAANAHEFIMGLSDGYQTDIGQRGVKLSGGQKQRLSIARVFLKNPPILIFDEATSALDNESERIVQQSLETLSRERTTFVIAHRLSTIKNAQRILVLTQDGIAEEGTHEALLQKGGVYAELYGAQF